MSVPARVEMFILKYIIGLHLHFSLDPGNRMEAGPRECTLRLQFRAKCVHVRQAQARALCPEFPHTTMCNDL